MEELVDNRLTIKIDLLTILLSNKQYMKIITYYQKPEGVWHKGENVVYLWHKEYWKHIYSSLWVKFSFYKNRLETFLQDNIIK